MPAFNINETSSVKEYLKSLDIFHHFDEIDVQLVANHLQITIISNAKEVYREFHKISDRQTNQIFFGDDFYTKMKSLSAALDIQKRLDKIDDFDLSDVFFNPGWLSVQSENENARYHVSIYDRDEGFRIHVKVTFFENTEDTYSERMHCTKSKLLELSQLEEAVQKLSKLDAVRTSK